MDKDEKKDKNEIVQREERVLKFWEDNKIFEKSLEKEAPKGSYIFYEGPPTANGKPGIHHLEARAFKDVIPRYKTMQGYFVRRKGGWDTHGLPVELQVEKQLGLVSKKDIEKYGIAKFNQKCKESVWEYLEYWNKFTKRIGFWLDQENPYITYHNSYIESVWNIIKEADNQKLLYKDYKVVPWCPRCGTTLSSHELAQGYEDVKDLSVYVKFRVVGGNDTFAGSLSPSADGALTLGSSACETPRQKHIATNTYILAWTTTPWTLLGNVALAVGKDIDYVKISLNGEILILAKEIFERSKNNSNVLYSVIGSDFEYGRTNKDGSSYTLPCVTEEIKGADLVGLEYEPLYPYLKENISGAEKEKMDKAYKIYPADFVTTEDGTGIVHTAVMYGIDDFNLGTSIGLPKFHLVGLDGKFLDFTGEWAGKFVRDENTAVDIIKDLAHRGLLFDKEKYEHSYPHCWRCKTALIYYARDSWYIKMSALRDEMIKENDGINWEPSYIKNGRFGEWLREVKDWAISRERYWGTPLPVWTCDKCKKNEVIGSVEDLKSKTKKSGNKYFVMRHGEAENNVLDIYCSDKNKYGLTNKGRSEALETAELLKNEKITTIFCSPFLRTKETAEIVAKEINFPLEKIIYDDRITELDFGDFSGKSAKEYWTYINEKKLKFDEKISGGESYQDTKNRFGEFLYDIDKKYKDENILIISHGIAIEVIPTIMEMADKKRSLEIIFSEFEKDKTGSLHKEKEFIVLPHNENYELDLHKPYIDEVELACSCGGNLVRAKEVMDVWLDSGTMPFSQDHYPFDFAQGKPFENKDLAYPADFISEAIDQTRGWFYTLHAVGVLMGKGKAYKNVICLGHLLDAKGKKMSKSIGNVVDPWEMIEKYGVDTLRLWMYSVNQPGESKNFDEKTVLELHRQNFGLLYNVLAFYELYPAPEQARYGASRDKLNSNNILDIWILARLNELVILCTEKLDSYKLLEPTRAIKDFIGDLSTWYLRRSRDRIKNEAVANPELEQAQYGARQTLYFVLKTLAKIMAPFAPFTAEDIWQKLKTESDEESVHLCEWPHFALASRGKPEEMENIILEMENIRKIVTLGLQARQKEGIPVRQPLGKLEVVCDRLDDKYFEIIKDELNVKEIKFTEGNELNIKIDTNITEVLRIEGQYRELLRAIQDMRKKMGLTPSDKITLIVQSNDAGNKVVEKFENDIKKIVLADELKYDINDGEDLKIGDLLFKIQIIKR